MDQTKHPVIFFDGVCNLCNSLVKIVIQLDRKQKLRFASLQSEAAEKILSQDPGLQAGPDTLVYLENGKLYFKSDAVLRISRKIGGLLIIFQIGYVMPGPWRNWCYDLIARNRYRWFGQRKQCMVPNENIRKRFLE
jgi:predicted DCC family thiol-disulfide oxidoreductase YuxK